jgi:hypothetical protein
MYISHGREPPTNNFQPSSEVVAAVVHPMWSVCEHESTTIAYESNNTIDLTNSSWTCPFRPVNICNKLQHEP